MGDIAIWSTVAMSPAAKIVFIWRAACLPDPEEDERQRSLDELDQGAFLAWCRRDH